MGQLQPELSVVVVDIAKEMDLSVVLCDCSEVEDQDWNRGDIYLQIIFAVMHGLLNPVQVPAGSVA